MQPHATLATTEGKDFFRTTDELMIQIPALPPPTLPQLQSSLRTIKKIEYDHSPTVAVMLNLATILCEGEKSISGEEYKKRIADRTGIFGYQQGVWIIENQDQIPEFMASLNGKPVALNGLLVVESSDDVLIYPSLRPRGRKYQLSWFWIGNGFYSHERIAIAAAQ